MPPLQHHPLLLLFLLFFSFSITTVLCLTTALSDVKALVAFKASISPSSISPWSCLASWDFAAADPCALPRRTHFTCGLACTTDTSPFPAARVTAITLDPAGYSGTLTPRLSDLTALAHLDLSGNSFRGPIPFTAPATLQTLSLASNSLSGPLPAALFAKSPSLVSVDISHNALTGGIPNSLGYLPFLRTLDLSFNRLSGNLPARLPPNLVELALRGNSLSGPLRPATFEALKYLEVAELAANAFSGKVEGWLLRLPSLQQLDLANNSLTHIEVSKADLAGAGDSSGMVALDLGFNMIGGALPPELAGFPLLTSLTLRHNRLTGAIPAEYYGAKRGSPFRRLFLDGNFLNGKVPPGFLATGGVGGGSGNGNGGVDAVAGSFADNCLQGCPASAPLCKPAQKPAHVCKEIYGGGVMAGGNGGTSGRRA